MSSSDPLKQQEFVALQAEGKRLAAEGRLEESLLKFQLAKEICPTPKVLQRIEKLKAHIKSNGLEVKNSTLGSYSEIKGAEGVYSNCEENRLPSDPAENLPKKLDPTYMKPAVPIAVSYAEIKSVGDYSNSKKIDSSVQKLSEEADSVFNENEIERKISEVKTLYEEARDLTSDGKLICAMKVLQKAQSIYKTEKVQKKIDKLKEFIENDTDDNTRKNITDDFTLYHKVYDALYPYQREGVAWMWDIYKRNKGGVLADDMGLGKTFQVIAFLSGMIDADLIKHVLIIMPVSLLTNWEREFKKWGPGISVQDFHGSSKKLRERNLLRVQKRGHVLLTSYGMILNNADVLSKLEGREFVWDYLILDEGHKIKNASKTTKAVYEIPSLNRLVLTGTPIQNNLKELWSLFDFVHQGTLLGSLKTFKQQYETPIIRSREKDATSGEKRLGSEISENLKQLINPYFIRRTKSEIWGKKSDENIIELENQMKSMTITMPKKKDFILWTFLSDQQIEIYNSFLHSNAVKEILMSKRSPLVELTVLKKICDHPRLLSQRACLQLGLNGELLNEEILNDESSTAPSIENVTDEILLQESGKLKLVISLIQHLKETGHRTLFFSLSRKILDMVQRILINRNCKVMRLDGTVSKTEERERRIQTFQNNSSYAVFLLTTQVGGVGLNLTAADRVIIYDPSWNPAVDAQAVDRVFRIGQSKNVIVYRLITCGSVEEKIYRRQVFKDSITRKTTGDTDPYRYFSKQELRELFTLENPKHSVTQVQLHEMHASQRKIDEDIIKHIDFLKALNIFGISDHDLLFTKEIQDNSEDNDENAISHNFIKQKVAAAHELIKKEASVVAEGISISGTFNRPYQLPVILPKKSKGQNLYRPPAFPEEIDLTEHDENKNDLRGEVLLGKINSLDMENTDKELYKPPVFPEEIDLTENDENKNNSHKILEKRNSLDMENMGTNEEQNISEMKSPDVTREKLRNHSLDQYAQDVNCRFEIDEPVVKGGRLSCVRQSGIFTSDNEDLLTDSEDSSKSASLSFVPNSASNTPQERKSTKSYQTISETPPSIPVNNSFTGHISELQRNFESTIRRITPLKVNRKLTHEDASFAQAMASSIIITPESSPKECQNQHPEEQSFELDESPIYSNRRKVRQALSDSSELENENEMTSKLSKSGKDAPFEQDSSDIIALKLSLKEDLDQYSKEQSFKLDESPIYSNIKKVEQIESESEEESETTSEPSRFIEDVPSAKGDITSKLTKESQAQSFNESPIFSYRRVVRQIESDTEESEADENEITSELSKLSNEDVSSPQTIASSKLSPKDNRELSFKLNDNSISYNRKRRVRQIESDTEESEDENEITSNLPKFTNENVSSPQAITSSASKLSPKESEEQSLKLNDNSISCNRKGVRQIESDTEESEDENEITSKLSKFNNEGASSTQTITSSASKLSPKQNQEQSFKLNNNSISFNRRKVIQIESDSEESDNESDSEESDNESDSEESDNDSEAASELSSGEKVSSVQDSSNITTSKLSHKELPKKQDDSDETPDQSFETAPSDEYDDDSRSLFSGESETDN